MLHLATGFLAPVHWPWCFLLYCLKQQTIFSVELSQRITRMTFFRLNRSMMADLIKQETWKFKMILMHDLVLRMRGLKLLQLFQGKKNGFVGLFFFDSFQICQFCYHFAPLYFVREEGETWKYLCWNVETRFYTYKLGLKWIQSLDALEFFVTEKFINVNI